MNIQVKCLGVLIALVSLFHSRFSAQDTNGFTSTPVSSLTTDHDDLPFGADSKWVYVMQYGGESGAQYFRAPRNVDPLHPGDLEAMSLQVIRDEAWSELGVISHVSLDAERQLAVISAKPYPGAGDFDLFIASSTENGYSRPHPLYSLNTSGDEVYPQFSTNGLYFSSNNNIYFAARKHQWQKAEVLAAPINTSADEISIAILNDSEMYVSSNRKGGGFDVYLLRRDVDENLASGFNLEFLSAGLPVIGAEIRWLDATTGNLVFSGSTDQSGKLSLDGLPSSRTLRMMSGSDEVPTKPGSVVRIVNPEGEIVRTYVVGPSGVLAADFLPLDEVGDLRTFESVDSSILPGRFQPLLTLNFEKGNSSPTETSLFHLDEWWLEIAESLLVGREGSLVIEGHADITGELGANDSLSELRAIWFKEWLLAKGLDASRLITRGMGARFPMQVCPEGTSESSVYCPPEVHDANRRVELRWKVD